MKKIIKGSMAVMLSALICVVFVGCSKAESATLPKSNIGDATYVYSGQAFCMNNHPDKNTTGYAYNFSVMFALENNE